MEANESKRKISYKRPRRAVVVTVTLIAEAGPGPAAPTGIRHPDRLSVSSDLGRAGTATMPVRLRRPPAASRRTTRISPVCGWPLGGPPRRTPFTPRIVPRTSPAPVPGVAVAGIAVAGITAGGAVPPAAASAQRYVRICLEVLNGFRPASHLRTLGGPVEFSTVISQLGRRRNGRGHFTQAPDAAMVATGAVANRRAGQSPATPRNAGPTAAAPSPTAVGVVRPGAPATTARRNAPGAAQPFRLLRLRMSEPRDGVAEIVAVLSYAGSSLAMALRLERHGDQWLCALAQVI